VSTNILETTFFNAYYQYKHLVKFVQTAYFHLVNAGTWVGVRELRRL
jgi:hypothetical protein